MFGLAPVFDAALRGAVLGVAVLLWVVLLVRIMGVRTLSKMTAFDLLVTLSTASLLATAATAADWTAFVQAVVAIAALLLAQYGFGVARRRWDGFRQLTENEPLLLMRDGRFLDRALRTGRISKSDIDTKLREVNVTERSAVRAVVLETTGDLTVIHGAHDPAPLLDGVRCASDDGA